jgi:hypothetical protein
MPRGTVTAAEVSFEDTARLRQTAGAAVCHRRLESRSFSHWPGLVFAINELDAVFVSAVIMPVPGNKTRTVENLVPVDQDRLLI